jgi:hypothetical protein
MLMLARCTCLNIVSSSVFAANHDAKDALDVAEKPLKKKSQNN